MAQEIIGLVREWDGLEHTEKLRRDGTPRGLVRAATDLATLFGQGEAERAERDARNVLDRVVQIAKEAHRAWDSDQDSRVGKLLIALAYGDVKYRADIDEIWAFIRARESQPVAPATCVDPKCRAAEEHPNHSHPEPVAPAEPAPPDMQAALLRFLRNREKHDVATPITAADVEQWLALWNSESRLPGAAPLSPSPQTDLLSCTMSVPCRNPLHHAAPPTETPDPWRFLKGDEPLQSPQAAPREKERE